MIILSGIILILYSILIIAFIIGFEMVKKFIPTTTTPRINFSIAIPFRDEAQALPVLLKSLKQLEYPSGKFEIIFIDDNSKDDSIKIINDFKHKNSTINVEILENNRKSASPKKDAVETAIKHANFDWIVTTDADCKVPQNWLQNFDAYIQKHNPKLIAAPVTYNISNSLLEKFQLLDFLSLQGSTIGGFGIKKPFLCNGANLCYNKQVFLEINGFKGNEHIASGDDIFLLEKMKDHFPNDVHFLKSNDSIVRTKPENTVKKLISQRVRWAAKSTSYKNNFSKLISVAVFSMNAVVIILFLGGLTKYFSWQLFSITLLIKICIDFVLLLKTTSFFNQNRMLKHYFWSSIIYPFFIIFIALTSFTSGYSWKGRVYKK